MTDSTNEWIDLTSFKSGNSQALRLKKELLDAAPAFSTGATMRLVSENAGIIVAANDNPSEEKERNPLVDAMLDAAANGHLLPTTSAAETQQRTGTIEKSRKLENVCYDIRGPVLKEAKRLEEEGNKILKLNIGNPAPFGFEAPDEILVDVIRNLPTAQGYSDSKGLYSARKAIMQHYQAQGIMDITVEDIYIGNGVSELIVQAMQALLNMGDEMLIPAPDYPLWTAAVSLSGGNAVHYMCDEESDWFPDLNDIRKKITPRTRGIVIINPNNPTGAVYSKELLLEIVEIAREHNLIIFADEIYDKILYDDAKHHSIAALAPDLLTVTFNGLSKTYRVAGFRQGWMVLSGPKEHAKGYIEGLEMLASMRLCANVPMQHAIQTAIGGYQSINEFIQPGGRLYEQRNRAWEMINDIPGVSCVKPKGALYMFPKIDAKRFNITNDQKMVHDLLLQQKVLLVQGTGFNWPYPDHVRIVTLPRVDELDMAIGRLAKFLETYKQA
ncbi:aminotransferase AlaT [Leminorella grimontii]|uniref:Glutamate-pyruvate aminotransferase AlaA n=1 Tax=Leminorella grimontii TaxID=82981 RepID=A0AAV5N5B0_9GAMM|nr:pyridoxal phosphate-dependent aminotransferase [Leminorella grimontii]KFC96789.1 aspartate aminotransferase [Leminorella grimontii ATCC 33999 = DSM 5078]GKX55936.1 aminotransferase AlaT [Leminorella grimontii]GKX58981.1 aminotransferase AlaT [Leminorella grimontii]VFS57498.1 Aspartate aminotransferase [Leminorella grimontii]